MKPFLLLLAFLQPLAAAPGSVCLDFSSFATNTTFGTGSSFMENSVIGTVRPGVSPTGQVSNGTAKIIVSPPGPGNKRLQISNAAVCFKLGCGDNISLTYTGQGGYINLSIDGDDLRLNNFPPGTTVLGGASVTVSASSISITQLTSGIGELCIGGQELVIDNLCFDPCENDSCFDFEGLTQTLGSGDVLIEDDTKIHITGFDGGSGTATPGSGNLAGHHGNEILLNGAGISFDIGCAQSLRLVYAQIDSGVEICINGEMLQADDFDDFSDISLGGVSITVKPNFIVFTGFIQSFSIGGTQIAIDHICPEPCEMDCIDFEEESLGTQYGNGDQFSEDNIILTVRGDSAEIRSDGKAGHLGQDIGLSDAYLQVGIDCAEGLSLHYGQYGGKGKIVINGDEADFTDVDDLDGVTVGGVTLGIEYDLVNGGTRGILTATGFISSFTIGGEAIFLDHICLVPCPDPDCVDFELFPLGASYSTGTALVEEMTHISVTPFQGNGSVTIGGENLAGHFGQEARLQNAGLDFRYPCASQLVFRYKDISGNVSLTVNGATYTGASFAALNGMTLGGAAVFVTTSQVTLTGEIQRLVVAGANLALDHVCQTRCELDASCIDFEALPVAGVWELFDGPGEDGVTFSSYFLFDENGGVVNIEPTLSTGNQQRAGHLGKDLKCNGAVAEIDFGVDCVSNLSLRYGEYSGPVNLEVNGDSVVATDLFDLNGTTIGGRQVFVTRIPVAGGFIGRLKINGPVTGMKIGGGNFYIDHLCFDLCEPIVIGRLVILSAEPINATQREAVMRVKVSGPATLRLQESTDLGQTDFWSTIPSTVFDPVPGQPDVFEMSAVHPIGDPRHFYRVRATYD